MSWQKKVFENFRIYAVTDLKSEGPEALKKIERAYQGGADIVQLRAKVLCDAAMIRLGLRIRKLASRYQKLFFVNDRFDIALATNANGLHLGQDDMPLAVARKLVKLANKTFWLGKSTHNLKQALAAEKEGADYIGVGPVFETPSKPAATATGLKFVRQASARIKIPWVAIGGIHHQNIEGVLNAGATRIAAVRAIFDHRHPDIAVQQLKKFMKG